MKPLAFVVVLFIEIVKIQGITINLPTSVDVREDTNVETQIFNITTSAVTAGATVSCSSTAISPTTTDFFVRPISGTTEYAVYIKASPTIAYSITPYEMTIQCTESTGASVSGSLFIYITQNSSPNITNLPASASLSTSTTTGFLVYTVTTYDSEGDQLYYGLLCNPVSPCPFQIFESGAILTTSSLAGTTTAAYSISVSVNDSYTTDGPKTLTITVTGINSNPVIANKLSSVVYVEENVGLSASIYQFQVTDVDSGDTHTFTASFNPSEGSEYFTINPGSGILSTSASNSINYEAISPKTFTATIAVSDGQGTDSNTFTISISDKNEAPTFPKTNYVLSTNESPAGTVVGTPVFGVTDPDAGATITYSIGCSQFAIDSSTGQVTFATDYDLDISGTASAVSCTVTAGDGQLSATTNLTIDIININDNTPSFGSSAYTFDVSVLASVNTVIGSIAATDGDIGTYGTISYDLNQTLIGSAVFGVQTNGDLYVASSLSGLSYGTSVSLTATVTDSGGLTDTAPITIILTGTTQATSADENAQLTFFQDTRNVVWFTVAMLIFIMAIALCSYMFVQYGCPWNWKLKPPQQKFHSLPNMDKFKGGNWKPWRIWERKDPNDHKIKMIDSGM